MALRRAPRQIWWETVPAFEKSLSNCNICPNIFWTTLKLNFVIPFNVQQSSQFLYELESDYVWSHRHFLQNRVKTYTTTTEFFMLRAFRDTFSQHQVKYGDGLNSLYMLISSMIKQWSSCQTCNLKCARVVSAPSVNKFRDLE